MERNKLTPDREDEITKSGNVEMERDKLRPDREEKRETRSPQRTAGCEKRSLPRARGSASPAGRWHPRWGNSCIPPSFPRRCRGPRPVFSERPHGAGFLEHVAPYKTKEKTKNDNENIKAAVECSEIVPRVMVVVSFRCFWVVSRFQLPFPRFHPPSTCGLAFRTQ